jgi:hypothetical protein
VQKVIDMRAEGIDIMFNCARLVDPKQFDLRILPDDCDQYFEKVNHFITTNGKMLSVEVETWDMVYRFWKTRKDSMTESDRTWRRDQFVKFTNEYDKRRKKNFSDVFSEISLDQLC